MINIFKYWLPVYLMAFIIFYFSSLSTIPDPLSLKTPNYIKHLAEYAIFSLLVLIAFKNTKKFESNYSLFTIIFITLFAISDETFQYFTPGRAPSILDLAIDSFSSFVVISFKKIV